SILSHWYRPLPRFSVLRVGSARPRRAGLRRGSARARAALKAPLDASYEKQYQHSQSERETFQVYRVAEGSSMRSFFTGVAVGFGVGLLIAPEAGSETRKRVVEKINVAKDQAQQRAE